MNARIFGKPRLQKFTSARSHGKLSPILAVVNILCWNLITYQFQSIIRTRKQSGHLLTIGIDSLAKRVDVTSSYIFIMILCLVKYIFMNMTNQNLSTYIFVVEFCGIQNKGKKKNSKF